MKGAAIFPALLLPLLFNSIICEEKADEIASVLNQLKNIVDHYQSASDAAPDLVVDKVKKDEGALDDELNFEADLKKIVDDADQLKCEDKDATKCNKLVDKCHDKATRIFCPRTCLVCCADLDEGFCKLRKRVCHASYAKERMRLYCPKTCEYCGKAPAPPPCLDTPHGCCWDRKTPASAPIGSGRENCPDCKDTKSTIFCKRFEPDCYDYHPNRAKGREIRAFCPKTCRVCGKHPQCLDDPKQALSCPRYKDEGLCSKSEKYMRYWCPKTCGFCKQCNDNQYAKCEILKKYNACKYARKEMTSLCPYTCELC